MIIKASHAILEPGRVVRDVRVEVCGPLIYAVQSGPSPFASLPDIDLGEAILTPGLVNPHAHLELEFCSGRTPFNGVFVDWLQKVRNMKLELGGVTSFPESSLRQLAASGCTTVVDHHTHELNWDSIDGTGIRHVPMREFFDFNNHDPNLAELKAAAQLGYAAHSPYTTSAEVACACRTLSDEAGLPLSIHLSEFLGEIELVRNGKSSEIQELLDRTGSMDLGWQGTGKSPVQYCADLGLLNGHTYAIHVNYLEPGDLDILAELRPTVVYCPRSHAFFNHPEHPIADMIAAGVPLALGTDSLASNDRLSPLHEAALVRERYPQVAAADVFGAITVAPLAPLGWDRDLGRLMPGFRADIAAFRLDGNPGDDFDHVLDAVIDKGTAELTLCNGKPVHLAPGIELPAEQAAAVAG